MGAKFFLLLALVLVFTTMFIVGSGSLKTLHNAEKFQVSKPLDTHVIPLPNVPSISSEISNVASGGSSGSRASHMSVSFEEIDLSRGFVLSDMGDKINSQFAIPEGKEKTVAFWFDLYTKYSNSDVIIFNKKYPWIIYEILSAKNLKHKITNEEVKFKVDKIKWTLTEMLEKDSLTTNEETNLFSLYNNTIGFEPALVKASIDSIDYTIGLKETFTAKMNYYSKLIKTIETILRKNKVEPEYARIFLTTPYTKVLKDVNAESSSNGNSDSNEQQQKLYYRYPRLSENLEKQFLFQSAAVNEAHSPIKLAQILSVFIKNLKNNKGSLFKDDWLVFNGDSEAAFLAALHADEYFQELFAVKKPSKALPIKAYRLKDKTSIADVIKMSGMPPKQFLEINSDIKMDTDLDYENKQFFKNKILTKQFYKEMSKQFLPQSYTFFVY